MRSLLQAVAGLVLVLVTAGCFVETENSLSDPDPRSMDPKLVGTWYFASEGEVALFSVAEDAAKPGAYRIVYTTIKAEAEKPVETVHYQAWRTVLNGQVYLNVKRTGGTTLEQPAMTIISYDLGDDGLLALRMIDTKRVIAAIEAGKLQGRFKKDRYVDEATITSPRAELVAFVAATARDELFPHKTGGLRKLVETRN